MKKFDVAIMNPPYDGSLHLKILEKVIPVADEVVNISPAGWVMDYAAREGYKKSPNKKYLDNLGPNIIDYKILNDKDFNDIFSIGNWGAGLISKYKENANSNLYKELSDKTNVEERIIEKLVAPIKEHKLKSFAQMYGIHKNEYVFFIKLARVHGHIGGKDQFDLTSRDIDFSFMKKDKEGKEIYFKTKEEAINFWNSMQSIIYKYLKYLGIYSYADFNTGMPFMQDYSKPWTNERFCKYFDITGFISDTEAEPGSEWEEILKTMEKYK